MKKMLSIKTTIIVMGLLFLLLSGYWSIEFKKLATWCSTKATIIYAYSQNISSPTDGAASDFGSDVSKVKYQYHVGSDLFIGSNVYPLEFIYFDTNRIEDLSTPGTITKIFYNPANPKESYIFIDYPYIQLLLVILCGLMLLVLGFFYDKFIQIIFLLIQPNSTL